jgi:hypothetical protein
MRARADGRALVSRLPEAEHQVVGHVGEVARRSARIALTETANRRVDDEHETLRRVNGRRAGRIRRRAGLRVHRLAHRLHLRRQERPHPGRHANAGERHPERVVENRLVRRRPLGARLGHRFAFRSVQLGRARCVALVRALVRQPKRERIDERVPHAAQRLEHLGLGIAHVRREESDGFAGAPFRAEQRVVVLRLDGHGDGRVALREERVAQAQHGAALVGARFAVQSRKHPPLLARARAQHEVHLAQAVVILGLVPDRNVGTGVEQRDFARGALEMHDRRFVGDRGEGQGLRFGDDDVSEARDDAKDHGLRERVTRDDCARAVVDERDFLCAVGQEEATTRPHRRAAHGDDRSVGHRIGTAWHVRDRALAEILRWAHRDVDPLEPRHWKPRSPVPGQQHVRAFDHRPPANARKRDCGDAEDESNDAQALRKDRGAAGHRLGRDGRERPRDVDARELGGRAVRPGRCGIAVDLVEQGQGAQCAARGRGIHAADRPSQNPARVAQAAVLERAPHERKDERRGDERARERAGRHGADASREKGCGRAENDGGQGRAPARGARDRPPARGELQERLYRRGAHAPEPSKGRRPSVDRASEDRGAEARLQ